RALQRLGRRRTHVGHVFPDALLYYEHQKSDHLVHRRVSGHSRFHAGRATIARPESLHAGSVLHLPRLPRPVLRPAPVHEPRPGLPLALPALARATLPLPRYPTL